MTGMWITTTGTILCILITWTYAFPLQTNTGGDVDSDEGDSDEDETSTTARPSSQNVTDQELTNKATLFLTRYFSNHGTEAPLHIPTNLNHTIVITIVPNNASGNAFDNLAANTEGPPTFGGDIPLFPSQQQQQQLLQVPSFQQQQQQEQLPNYVPHQSTSEQPQVAPSPASPPPPQTAAVASVSSLTTTTTTTTTTTPIPVSEQPVDNIEDAILEALSIAGGEGGQSSQSSQSSQAVSNIEALIQSGVIPGLSNGNNGGSSVIQVPSNFGPVFIQAGEQQAGTAFINQNTPAPPVVAAAPPLPNPNIIFLQQLLPPPSNNAEDTGGQRPIPGAGAISAVSGILGSISQGNLGGVVQNGIKLVEAPVVQNTAKLATVAILHNVFQGLNPCNYLPNGCGPRPALKKTQ